MNFKKLFTLLLTLTLLLGASNPAQAALSAAEVLQIQSTATSGNVNSGYFNPAGANFLTDGAATSATGNAASFTSASYSGVAGDVNAWLYIVSGTNWNPVCYYKVTSVSAGALIVDSTLGHGVCVTNNRYLATTVAGVATTASPTGATWGIDYSMLDTAEFVYTDLASLTGTTVPCTVTSVTHPFGPQDVHNGLKVNSGTNWTAGTYEVVSVSGVTATLDKACGTAATLTLGTAKFGGALSLASSDSTIFALGTNSSSAAARFFVKGNATYTLSGAISAFTPTTNIQWPITVEGYNALRGDRPTDSTRPVFAMGTNLFSACGAGSGGAAICRNLKFTGTGSSGVVAIARSSQLLDSYVYNNSTTASRAAITTSFGSIVRGNELISLRGPAIGVCTSSNCAAYITENYIHDSDTGISGGGNTIAYTITNNVISNNVSYGINFSTAISSNSSTAIDHNTIYGAENKLGTGINFVTGTVQALVRNNILYGLTTGIAEADTTALVGAQNDYFNNTTDVTNFLKGASDLALNPSFAGVAQRTGSTATTTAGNHLVQSGATFVSWGVTPGRDFLYLASGTGVTVGKYGIASVDSETQITTDVTLAADATADKTWSITTGRNFAIGTNLKAQGTPATFPGATTTGYTDIGAVQRQEGAGSQPTVSSVSVH